MKIFIHFFRNTTYFHWCSLQNGFFHSSTTPVLGGGPSLSLRNLFFFIQYKKKLNWSFRGTYFFCWNVLGTSDIQGCCSPKVITYIIYTLIHDKDPIPCRITYIEYKSPVNIFIHFSRNTTHFRWCSLQNSFCHSSTTPVVGGTLQWAWIMYIKYIPLYRKETQFLPVRIIFLWFKIV